jgi:hypothetical protein
LHFSSPGTGGATPHQAGNQTGRLEVATPEGRGAPERTGSRGGIGGISVGGILVIIGIIVALFWSLVLGIIIILIGLIAFGGFVRGRWY